MPEPGLRSTTRALVSAAVAHAKTGAATVRAATLDPPPKRNALQAFAYGLALPFAVLRATMREPSARKKFLRVGLIQLGVVLTVALIYTLLSDAVSEAFGGATRHVQGKGYDFHLAISGVHVFWSVLAATLVTVETIVVALSRDYNKDVQREVALASGVPPEDDALKPRVRLNFAWLKQQLKRKLRGWLVFAAILPLAEVVSSISVVGQGLKWTLVAAWGLYWSGVFTTSKTARAWEEPEPRDPLYLRGFDKAAARVAPIRWGMGWYAKLVRRFTRSMFSPAARFEKSPAEISGLAAARLLRLVPGVSIMLRPVFPIAAAHIVLRRERELEKERLAGAVAGPYRTHSDAGNVEAPFPERPRVRIEGASDEDVDTTFDPVAPPSREARAEEEHLAEDEAQAALARHELKA